MELERRTVLFAMGSYFLVYNPPIIGFDKVTLESSANSESLGTRMLRTRDALQHVPAERWDGLRIIGMYGVQ
jgi:hypothetical protein